MVNIVSYTFKICFQPNPKLDSIFVYKFLSFQLLNGFLRSIQSYFLILLYHYFGYPFFKFMMQWKAVN